jgi:hypothetical protein
MINPASTCNCGTLQVQHGQNKRYINMLFYQSRKAMDTIIGRQLKYYLSF